MSDAPPALTARLGALLAHHPSLRETQMFGVHAFMVEGKLLVGAGGDGSLLVRADPRRSSELLARPGATQAEMGAGRSMGPSWVRVAAEAVTTDDELSWWVDVALEYNPRLPG